MSKKVLTIVLPTIQAMMSGVVFINRAHDLVTLTYTDNTREAAKISNAKWEEIHESVFRIISEVQAQRSPLHVYKSTP